MTRNSLIKPLLLATMLAAGSLQAAPAARQVLAVSPVDDIVAQYPAMMSQGIREGMKQNTGVPPILAETLGTLVRNSFSATDIEQRIVADLQAQLSGPELQSVHDWYTTPVARKISAAEIAASSPEAWQEIQARAPELNERFQGSPKAAMFDRFDRAARATESTVDTSIAVQLGLASAMAAFSPDSASYEQLRQRIESQRSTLRGVIGQQVYDSYLYTYRNISAQELELYLNFLESPAGSAFARVVTNSIQQAITEPMVRIGEQMSRLLTPAQ